MGHGRGKSASSPVPAGAAPFWPIDLLYTLDVANKMDVWLVHSVIMKAVSIPVNRFTFRDDEGVMGGFFLGGSWRTFILLKFAQAGFDPPVGTVRCDYDGSFPNYQSAGKRKIEPWTKKLLRYAGIWNVGDPDPA